MARSWQHASAVRRVTDGRETVPRYLDARALARRRQRVGIDPRRTGGTYPCDGLVDCPDGVLFRGVDVEAPAGVVFRWLCQLRVAPYSYDWIDNLGRRSPRELIDGLDDLEVGDRVATDLRAGRVRA